ncbi:hypothetical protein MGALJ_09720 [Mycobacterium gallinarum]|uniref:Uncharacterized protein n=1 Tax=Mycobacterium gallinarum TaxID=39689 RepID=A0A9W4AZC6_9MYCO|nr:hypothetical protein [Mycobacterium gallinarum]BBY91303.1 hypothetical protein MGALJ_09720 [Mycobacterium gallinarum]
MATRASHVDDPVWQRARALYVDPPDGTSSERLVARVSAASAMYEMERSTNPQTDEQRDRIVAILRTGAA